MNRFIKKTVYGILTLILALSGVLNIASTASAQVTPACKVTGAQFFNHPINAGSLDLLNSTDPTATLRITSENCGGRSGAVFLTEIDTGIDDPIPGGFSFDFNSSGTTNIELIIGEMLCDSGSSPNCKVGGEVSIKSTNNAGPTYVGTPFKFLDSGQVLLYNCKIKDDCKNTTVWKKVVAGNPQGVGTCLITDARFLNNATTPANFKILNSGNPAATLEITGNGCVGWKAFITLKEINDVGPSGLVGSNYEVSFDATGKKARADFTVGERECDNRSTPDCAVAAVITPFRDNPGQPRSYGTMKEFLEFSKSLQYDCKTVDDCKNDQDWIFGAPSTTANRCSIVSAEFDPSSDGSSTVMSDGSTGITGPRFYNHLHRPSAIITIETKNCATKPIIVTLLQHGLVTDDHVSALNEKKLFVPEGEIITIGMKTGEDYCGTAELGCEFYLKVSPSPIIEQDIYVSLDKPRGKMTYGCDSSRTLLTGICSDKWEYISDNALKVDSNGVPITNGGVLGDPNSACLDENGKPIEGCYEVYGQLGDLLKDRLNLLDNKFDTLKQDSLGGLINAIIAIATGIAGVIAVGMIMYQGFLIMKTDNANTKTEAKSRIGKTILGFLLLLGIFVILRTINPDLLNLNPAISAITLKVGADQDPNEVLDETIKNNPDIAKIYATSKAHWRDGGSVNPSTEAARKALTESMPSTNFTDISGSGLTLKAGTGKLLDKTVAPKVIALNNALKAKSVSMTITEAFKPTTYKHYASCQYTGTCIDADIPFSVANVATLISEAQKVGLVAVWETTNKNNYESLTKAGVPQSNILLFTGHITGDHASVYDYK